MRRIRWILAIVAVANCRAAAVDQLVPWLLDEGTQLRGIPFSEVIVDVTGKKVIPFDAKNDVDPTRCTL
jgi:hypothetical protein